MMAERAHRVLLWHGAAFECHRVVQKETEKPSAYNSLSL